MPLAQPVTLPAVFFTGAWAVPKSAVPETGSNSKKQERQEEQSRPTKITLGLFTPYFYVAAVKNQLIFLLTWWWGLILDLPCNCI